MRIKTINTGNFKLDGGAMFGVVPKAIWNKLNPADENNMCNWAMRCLLVEDGNRLALIDNGIGNKQDAKFYGHYYLNGDDTLEKSIKNAGYALEDFTDIILTHLHFDHCGGSVFRDSSGKLKTTFPNAKYWIGEEQWNSANKPNAREKASYLIDNFAPIQSNDQLHLVNKHNKDFFPNIDFEFVYGHTEGMMLPIISIGTEKILYLADLMPSFAHIKPHYVMSYDIRPLDTMTERERIGKLAAENNWTLFFEHDAVNECAKLKLTERGFDLDKLFNLSELGSSFQ